MLTKSSHYAHNKQLTYRVASQFFTVANVSSIVVLQSVDKPCLNNCSDSVHKTHNIASLATHLYLRYSRQEIR